MGDNENSIANLFPGRIIKALEQLPPGSLREEFADLFEVLLQALMLEGQNRDHGKLRKAVQETAPHQIDKFKNLCEANPQLIWTADSSGQHDYFSPRWTAYTGTSVESSLGLNWLRLVHPEDRGLCAELWAQRVADGHKFEMELRLRKADGEYYWHLARAIAVHDDSGEIEHWYGSYTEIEEQRKLMAELIQARDQAQEASKFKSEFVANMSHELRTPMNGVLGMVEVLLRSDLNPKAREYTLMIREAGRSLLAIINDVLDFSKIEAGKLEISSCDFDLLSVVEGVGEILAPQAEGKSLELVTYIDPAIPEKLMGDPLRLRQILLNLGGNAVKFTETGSIVMRAEKLESHSNCIRVRFTIADTGIGIAEERRSTLFEPFTQADGSISRRYGGTGLGLNISHRLVDLMGGVLMVESEEHKGSVFSFNLLFPLEKSSKKTITTTISRSTVMLVGVRPLTADCIIEYAQKFGLKAEYAADFDQAFALLEKMPSPPTSVIVEVNDSKDHCLEFGRKVSMSAALKEVQIMYITRLDRFADFESSTNKQLEHCLTRPIRRADLHSYLTATPPREHHFDHTQEVDALPPITLPIYNAVPKTSRVLVADDNPMNQHVARLLLGDMGLEVEVVDSGIDAVTAFKANKYDIVFLDCQMPNVDGYEACTIIKQIQNRQREHVPIIAMTAKAMIGSREQCLSAGMDDYISKPIDPAHLERLVSHWLELKGQGKTGPAMSLLVGNDQKALTEGNVVDFELLQSRFNEQIIKKLLTMFLESAEEEVSRIEQSLASQAFNDVKDQTHAFRGACGTICATVLLQHCREMELAAAGADKQQCYDLFANLKHTLHSTLSEIDQRLVSIT